MYVIYGLAKTESEVQLQDKDQKVSHSMAQINWIRFELRDPLKIRKHIWMAAHDWKVRTGYS